MLTDDDDPLNRRKRGKDADGMSDDPNQNRKFGQSPNRMGTLFRLADESGLGGGDDDDEDTSDPKKRMLKHLSGNSPGRRGIPKSNLTDMDDTIDDPDLGQLKKARGLDMNAKGGKRRSGPADIDADDFDDNSKLPGAKPLRIADGRGKKSSISNYGQLQDFDPVPINSNKNGRGRNGPRDLFETDDLGRAD